MSGEALACWSIYFEWKRKLSANELELLGLVGLPR